MEAQNEFKKADDSFDKIEEYNKSKVQCIPKIFMKISDVDPSDAEWFRKFCDNNFDGKQFLAIKAIRFVMENSGPVMTYVHNLGLRMNLAENAISQIIQEKEHTPEIVEKKINIPTTQGGNRK